MSNTGCYLNDSWQAEPAKPIGRGTGFDVAFIGLQVGYALDYQLDYQ